MERKMELVFYTVGKQEYPEPEPRRRFHILRNAFNEEIGFRVNNTGLAFPTLHEAQAWVKEHER